MDGKPAGTDTVEWLKMLLALIAAVLLVVIYVFVLQTPAKDLLVAAIPSAIVVLVTIPTVYFVFYSKGLTPAQLSQSDSKTIADELAIHLTSLIPQIMGIYKPEPSSPVIGFYETFRHVDWPTLIDGSHSRIDIVVYYFDSWVNAHYDTLVRFFKRSGTSMRVFVSDPTNQNNLETVARLFPEYNQAIISEKVAKTGERFQSALDAAGGKASRLEVYYVPHTLNYSAQSIDDKTLVLSIFEMFRDKKIDAPAIVIDLTKAENVSAFWHKELDGLLKVSRKH